MHVLQVEALCWCGKRATHNARTENGEMVVEGEVIVVGDVDQPPGEPIDEVVVAYEVLCRQHHRRRMTAARAKAVSMHRRAAAVRGLRPQQTTTGMTISSGVSEPCRPTRVVS